MPNFANSAALRARARFASLPPFALLFALLFASHPASVLRAQAADTSQHPAVTALVRQLATIPPVDDADFVRHWMHPRGFAYVPESTMVHQLGLMRRTSGGLRVVQSERRGAAVWLRVTAENDSGALWIDAQPMEDRLVGWRVRLDHFARSGPIPALPDREVPADSVVPIVQRWLDWWERHDRWSGTIGLSRYDTTVLIEPVGLADRARNIPNSAQTRFHLGSSNKMLTAVAVLQLVQDGRLSLDDPLARVLPDFPLSDIAQRVTVRHLLEHTSGFGGLFDRPNFEAKRRYGSNAAYLPLFATWSTLFEPGTRFEYSNEGFLLAGAVIERVTGTSYDSVLASRILRPAGMTGWCDCMGTPQAAQRAFGYSHREDTDPLGFASLTDNEYFLFAEGLAAGGYYATAEDYLRFAAALRRGALLDTTHRALLLTKSALSPASRPYALGMQLSSFGGEPAWGHGGGGGRSGVGTQFASFADGRWTVAVMGNRDVYLATEVLRPLMTFLARQR